MGWAALKNGNLLDAVQPNFDVLLTVDRNLPHQQNLRGRTIALVVLVASSNRVEDLKPLLPYVEPVLQTILPGNVVHVEKPAEEDPGAGREQPAP